MASVSGDVDLMPVSDVVLWMAGRKLTGTLAVRRRGVEARFVCRDGICAQASSTDPREYFGQHLINFGYIDEEQLQRAFDTQKETHVPLGRVLVMVEAITPEQLQKVLTFKTREGFLEALCWEEGTWKVTPDVGAEVDRELDCETPIDLRDVWSEASARQQMWSEIRRVFPSDATRVEVLPSNARVDSSFDRRLLQLMLDGKTVGEAALELRSMDFQTYARLYDLATRQLVRPKVTTSATPVHPKRPTASAFAGLGALAAPMQPSAPSAPSAPWTPPAGPPPVRATAPAPWTPSTPSGRAQTPAPASAPWTPPAGPAPARHATPPPLAPPDDDFDLDIIEPPPTQPMAPPPQAPPRSPPRAATPAPAPALSSFPSPPARAPTPAPHAPHAPTASRVMAPPSSERAPSRVLSRMTTPAPKQPTPMGSFFGAGSYMMVKPEKAEEAPGVKIPLEAADPEQALRVALAGRDWSAALLISQRILERDPINSEALGAFRVADAQIRRREKEQVEPDFARVPVLAMAMADVALTHLTSKERYVLSRVDGKRTLQQIAAVSPIERNELVRIVEAFVGKGVLRL